MRKIIIFQLLLLVALSVSLEAAQKVETQDKNNDSKPDMWIYFENERPAKIEGDRNYDGKLDLWIIYGQKGARTTQIDLNFDGRPDWYSYYQYNQRAKLEIDTDYDGNLDQINEYMDGKLVKMQKLNKDGKMETVFDVSSRYSSQKKHTEYYEADPKALGNSQALPEKQKPE
ncbi:MAG: hypothetical protein Q8O12_03940 [Candidatus Omnitrophota bacterium]|nr:hypothetical protein [Candidatus Omnitrophota bacterium]